MSESTLPDAQLFSLVSQLTSPPPGDERRGRLRQSYPTVQMVAPYRNGILPQRDEFKPVQCQDLSTGGFSFYLSEKPDFDRLVVSLSTSNQSIQLTAAVCHTKAVEIDNGQQFHVGCKFLGRVML